MKLLHSLNDNTDKIKRESAKNSRLIEFIDQHVAPKAPYIVPASKQGQTVYSVDCRWGFATLVEDGAVIAVDDKFVRSEEWKPTAWTATESADYYEHRMAESLREAERLAEVLKANKTREQLAKQFLG